MSGNTSPRAVNLTGLSPTEIDTCAQYAWLSGRIGEAIDLYSDLARLHKRSPHVHFKLGYLYLALQDHTTAAKYFSSEIDRYGEEVFDAPLARSSPSSPSKTPTVSLQQRLQQRAFLFCTYAGRSEAYYALGEVTKAENDTLFITNRGGTTQQSLLAMGCLYFRFGMLQRADQCFERCAVADNNDPEYLVEHAELRLAQRRYAIAASMFEKCRQNISSASPTYHRALIGEGAALIRQNKLQDAVILLLQAMNTLRNAIHSALSEWKETLPPTGEAASPAAPPETTKELIHHYHRAVNLYGGLCMMKGELKAAIDTYCSILQPTGAFTDVVPFHLQTICIIPGTKNQLGEAIDSAKISTKNLSEAVRHLTEMEWRYGPDACLYFHRANIHRATGDFDAFLYDLSLVESMDSCFLKKYVARDCLGDFLDVETIAWIPTKLVEGLHDALESNEYRIPSIIHSAVASPMAGGKPTKSKAANGQPSALPKHRAFSEVGMLTYLEERVRYNKSDDIFAQVFQLDIFRRLPESKRKPGKIHSVELLPWEGVVFDDVHTNGSKPSDDDKPLQDLLRSTIANHRNHPCVHMFAGMIELQKFNVAAANQHFVDAVDLIDRSPSSSTSKSGSGSTSSSLSQRWNQHLMQQAKYYCLVWRSLTRRIKIEMEKAVEDLNLAAAVVLGDKICGGDSPLLLIQRTLIMLLNGHLKSAYKLLRQLKKSLRQARRHRPKSRTAFDSDAAEVIDMFSNAGLNSFHLMNPQVQREALLVTSSCTDGGMKEQGRNGSSTDDLGGLSARERARDRAEEEREEREEEEAAISMVKYALSKKGSSPTEMLDKFYESGLLKLSLSGSISQVIPFFQAILSMEESYLPPTNFASLEIFKCKEQDFMEEKLFNCFVRLGKRSKWLEKKIKWKFEALIDSNLAHAYLPTDMETLWHRARLMQDQKNFTAAINDLTDCLQLMAPHFSWEKGKKGEKASFNNEAKRVQWLQLQLERGMLHMELYNWDQAINDLNMVIAQSGKKNPVLQASAYEARSSCLIHLRRYGHAIQDLQFLLMASKETKKSKMAAAEETRQREDRLLNCVLVGNLYCQLAVDQMKASSALTRKTSFVSNPVAMKEAKAAHLNKGFLTRATEYYQEAEDLMPDHFLVHYFRGRMLTISGQSQLATRSLTECLRLHSMFLPALFLRGCVYAQENLFVLALADFYRVRHRVSTYPNLHTSIGYCHLESGSLSKAVESFTEAIFQNPADVDALYMRGCTLQELMILGHAVQDFERVISLSPAHFRALYQRAVCHLLTKNFKAALSDTNAVVHLQSEWRDGWILHGYASFCAEKYDSAVASYGSAIASRDPTANDQSRERDSPLFVNRAFAYIQAGRYTAALTDLDLALKRDNENYIAYIAKAYCLFRVGDRTRAAQALANSLPNYKQIKLPDATQVLDSEKLKAQMKNDTTAHEVSLTSGFGLPSQSDLMKNNTIIISASPDDLFKYRKYLRDCEPKQILRPLSQVLAERRASSTVPGVERRTSNLSTMERRTSNMSTLERRTSSTASPQPTDQRPRSQRLFSTLSMLPSMEAAAELAKARAKQLLRAKFMRVLKKITFQHRVLKALENSTTSKYRKSQQMTRMLNEVMQPTVKVGWPKGTLTTRILLWAFNAYGIHHAHAQNIDDALMAFTLAIQAHPYNCDAYFNRGNVYLQLDVQHSAISGFGDAIEQDDNCFRAHNNMGVAYYKGKRMEEAQDAFSTGLHHASHAKERAILMYNLGVTFQALEKPEEALEFYQQAIALDSSRTEFFNNRSAILHHQMRYTVALEDYNRALKLHGRQTTEGQDEDEKSLETHDQGFAARMNRAQLYIAMGNCTLASQDLKIVLKALSDERDQASASHQLPGDHTASSLQHAASAATKAENIAADIQLATELLSFCQKWHTAMRIAVKDFLFALHAVPCFTPYEFSPLFGPELVRLQERETELAHSEPSSEVDRLQVFPLPIQDSSFFNYQRAFGHWLVSDDFYDENEADDREPHAEVRFCKREQWTRSYVADLRDALRCAREDDFEAAARCLLRAHYKTSLDSHDEYLLLTWRIQVTMNIQSDYEEDKDQDDGLGKAIVLLRDFLRERRTPEEVAHDEDMDESQARRPRLSIVDDGDDELDERIAWRAQRRVIRADLFTLLGSLYQLNGQMAEARASCQQALHLRSDHVVAMLNFLQLSVVVGEYETALDTSIHLLDMFLNFGKETKGAKHGPAIASRTPVGLLNADRSVAFMLPSIRIVFENGEIATLGAQLLTLLKEYRGWISAQIQANTSHIFKTQGAIAHVVQELRFAIATEKMQRTQSLTIKNEMVSSLPLSEFNETLDAYNERVVQDPAKYNNDSEFVGFYDTFQAQFAELCEQVVKSLPVDPEADSEKDPLGLELKPSTIEDNQTDSEQTIEEFLATSERREEVEKRRMSEQARARRTSSLMGSSQISPSSRRSSSLVESAAFQPQRPTSGPQGPRGRRQYS